MKKLYILLFTILITSVSFGQTTLATQGFEGAGTWTHTPAPAAYNEVSGSDIWEVSTSVGAIGSAQSGSNFWGIRDIDNSGSGGAFDHTLTFPNINIAAESDILITFYYYTDGYESSDYLRVEFFFDDVSQGIEELGKNTDAWTLFSKVVPNGTTNARLTLIARQNGGSDYGGFDNILLQSGANVNPSLSITSPIEASTVNSGNAGFNATLDIQNFTISGDAGGGTSDNTGDGFIKYSLDSGASVSKFDTGATNFTGLASGAHSLYFELVDNSGNALGTPVNATVNFTVNDIVQSLPFFDPFDYTATENLGDQTIWQNFNSGDEMIISSGSLSYSGLASSTGNSVSFDGSGMDPQIDFTDVTSGSVFVSFIFKVTDQSSITDLTDGGYFAILGNFDSRLWVRPNPDATGTTFDIGFGSASGTPPVTSGTFNVGDDIFVVMSYETTTGNGSAWINPSSGDFGGSAPTATLTDVDTAPATNLNKFILRQDSTGETPFMLFDELRIGTSWADVTPVTLGINDFITNNFKIFPNPISLGYVNIFSRNETTMKVNVFDILGKQVINSTITNNRLDVSNLNPGLYIMRLTQDNATVTKKLVIQ